MGFEVRAEEELAKIAGVKVATVRRTAHELLELFERDDKPLENWEPVHDSIGVTHWLPPRRCLTCDD